MTDELKISAGGGSALGGKGTEIDIDALPQQVREWLMSIALTYLVIDLNKRLGINNNLSKFGVIPDLIGDIAAKKTDPKEMIPKIAKYLEIDQMKATSIAKEIKEKMLRPIEITLRKELGVDINLIDFQQTTTPAPAPVTPAFQTPIRPVTPASPAFQTPRPPTPVPPAPPAPQITKIPINVIKPGSEDSSDKNPGGWLNKLK